MRPAACKRSAGRRWAPRAAAAALCAASPGGAQQIELELPSAPPEASAEIIGGQVAVAANWPATFVFTGSNAGPCTATAIGPRTLLTAAHCVDKVVSGKIKGSPVSLWCEAHPWYEPNATSYDVALCVSSAKIPTLNARPYETIDPKVRPRAGHERLTMLGYGCTDRGGSGGTLYEGTSPVTEADSQIVLFYTQGGAAVCAGDSGGGAFRTASTGFSRRIVGVASGALAGTRSRFVAVADAGVTSFIGKWANRQVNRDTKEKIEVQICGLDQSLLDCRS